jgi:hypothetical protein
MTEAAMYCEQTEQIIKCIDRAKELKKEYTIKYTKRGAWNPYSHGRIAAKSVRAAVLAGIKEEFPATRKIEAPSNEVRPIVPKVTIPSMEK